MTSKELVEICNTRSKCEECYCQSTCLEYQDQFGCHPFDLVTILRDVPEAYSDTIITSERRLNMTSKELVYICEKSWQLQRLFKR